jgi:regulator of protease activity HflC (stomatin/prohibitin superfamily)
MSRLYDLLSWVLGLAHTIVDFAISFIVDHPMEAALALFALLRLLGTTIQTGSKGVLFAFGHVRKELEPGFHPLLPIILAVRKIPIRSITQDLPKQRLVTADGLVYDVQANIVYHVVDPKVALTQIDSLTKGIEVVVPLVLEKLLRSQTRTALLEFKTLEAELIARVEEKLQRWGVTVEHVGFKTIAPTKQTLHLTQLALLTQERYNVLQMLVAEGVSPAAAVAL